MIQQATKRKEKQKKKKRYCRCSDSKQIQKPYKELENNGKKKQRC